MRRVEFTVPGDVNEVSPNARLHFYERAHRVRAWRAKTCLLARHQGLPEFTGKVRVSFHVKRGRCLDECNLAGSGVLKAIVDGLVDARVIRRDTPDFMERGEVTQEGAKQHKGREEIVVQIEERGE